VPAVQQVHRDFLLLRDYKGLAALFLIGFRARRLRFRRDVKGVCLPPWLPDSTVDRGARRRRDLRNSVRVLRSGAGSLTLIA
jgi:hypothetical protein